MTAPSSLLFAAKLRYPAGFALDVRFEAGPGVTALVGPSGSGKSTILNLIAGITRPDDGTIRLGSRTLVDTAAGVFLPPEQRVVGLVYQDHCLFPHLSVRQNLRFGQDRPGGRKMDLARLVSILALDDVLDRYPATLSGGQKQRLALGRALLRGPELLLLDEPLANLDLVLKEHLLSYLERALAEWQVPTLIVSHDPAEVRRLASQVFTIREGKVVNESQP